MMRAGRLRKACTIASLVAVAMVASAPVRSAPSDEPDRPGGWTSERVVVRFRTEVIEEAERRHALGRGVGGANPLVAAGTMLRAAVEAWGVTKVHRAYPFDFGDPILAAKYGLDRIYVLDVPRGTDTRAMAALFHELRGDIEGAAVDLIGMPAEFPANDPYLDEQYGLDLIDAPQAWDLETGSLGRVVVAIIDSGVNGGVNPHPEFECRLLPGINAAQLETPYESLTDDQTGHGTHVTGIAAATGNNGLGIAGVTWGSFILPVRVYPVSGLPTAIHTMSGILWAADNGADVCNISLQFYSSTATPMELSFLEDAVNYAYDRDVLVIAAAGNFAESHVAYPARFENCMAVTATDDNDAFYVLSNHGPEVDVCAPGVEVLSTDIDPVDPYSYRTGTSMAAPFVSGLAALIKSYDPTLTSAQIWNILTSTADDLGDPNWDNHFGHGRINAFSALQAVEPPLELGIASTTPPTGAIDARRPSVSAGWSEIEITFDGDASALARAHFTVLQRRAGETCLEPGPEVTGLASVDVDKIQVTLSHPIEPGAWTMIRSRTSVAGACLASLPADVSGDGMADASDVGALIDCLEAVSGPCEPWKCDLDRLGTCTAADLTTLIDLLNGAGPYDSWASTDLGPSPCAP